MRRLVISIGLTFLGIVGCSEKPAMSYYESYKDIGRLTAEGLEPEANQAVINLADRGPLIPNLEIMAARIEVRENKMEAAKKRLNKIADVGLGYSLWDMEDFKNRSELEQTILRHRQNRLEIGKITGEISFSTPNLIVEDVSYSSDLNAIYVASIYNPRLIIQQANKSETIIDLQAHAKSLIGIDIRETRQQALVCATLHTGGAGVIIIDLTSQEVESTIAFPHSSDSLCNDLSGTATTTFITDSKQGQIWNLTDDILENITPKQQYFYPNGIYFQPHINRIIVADATGLHCLQPDTGISQRVKHSNTISLAGIDGLTASGEKIYGLQNSVEPVRIIELGLSEKRCEIENYRVVGSNLKAFINPTTLAVKENNLLVVSNSEFGRLDETGLIDDLPIKPFSLIQMEISSANIE